MSNFYGKRFLSSLVGALTVLGSPIVSAGKNESGRGDLGKGVHSASRDKNNGSLGKLKSSREVKSVDGLKKVLKETDGEVVGVSPDGKGGFVAFIKTPTGIVTVTIVGVALSVIIGLVAYYVFHGRKNGGAKGEGQYIKGEGSDELKSSGIKNISDELESSGIKNISDELKSSGIKNIGDEVKSSKIENIEKETPKFVVENATGGLLASLFKDKGEKYDSFVLRLLNGFFSDKSGALKVEFDDCKGNLDRFLELVFNSSTFDGGLWKVNVNWVSNAAVVQWDAQVKLIGFGKKEFGDPFVGIFNYLSYMEFVKLPSGGGQADWVDKISAVLFSFWCLCNVDLDGDNNANVKEKLEKNEDFDFEEIFNMIKGYVEERLKAAGKGYDGKELPAN